MTEDEVSLWPSAPRHERPKNLYLAAGLSPDLSSILEGRGWRVIDVRVLPNQTDGARAEALKATLEGIRQGTIEADKDKLRWLELEAKVYGLLTGKDKLKDDKPKISGDVLEDLLSFGKKTKKLRKGG